MAASEAFVGLGTGLSRGDGADPEVFTAIAEVRSIDGFEFVRATADATHLKSTDGYEEQKLTTKRASPLSVELNFLMTDAEQNFDTGLGDDFEQGTLRNFQVELADDSGDTLQFAAFVTKYRLVGINPQGVMVAQVELTPQGKPFWVP